MRSSASIDRRSARSARRASVAAWIFDRSKVRPRYSAVRDTDTGAASISRAILIAAVAERVQLADLVVEVLGEDPESGHHAVLRAGSWYADAGAGALLQQDGQ
jgi:hypothetical protein